MADILLHQSIMLSVIVLVKIKMILIMIRTIAAALQTFVYFFISVW